MRPKNDSGFTGSIARYAFKNLDLPLERWSCHCERYHVLTEFFR